MQNSLYKKAKQSELIVGLFIEFTYIKIEKESKQGWVNHIITYIKYLCYSLLHKTLHISNFIVRCTFLFCSYK